MPEKSTVPQVNYISDNPEQDLGSVSGRDEAHFIRPQKIFG
jgi:hypothetical protein